MPPKKRNLAGCLNYSKRKDLKSTELNIHSTGGGAEFGSGEVGTGSGEARVVGESTGAESEETRGDEYDSTVKLVKIDDVRAMAAKPLNEWLDNLPRDDVQHMALLLYSNLSSLQKTDTASVVASFLHKSERTIRRWIDDFVSNDGEFSDTQQGHYVRDKTLMSNEELCERATVYVRENAAPRGRPNLTASAFCQWVNNELLPNYILDPGYPRRVSVDS